MSSHRSVYDKNSKGIYESLLDLILCIIMMVPFTSNMKSRFFLFVSKTDVAEEISAKRN